MASIFAENLSEVNKVQNSDYVRLLRPRRSRNGKPLYELKTFSLRQAPRYAALSYSWGTKPQSAVFNLQNGGTRGSLNITSDLNDALRRISFFSRNDDWPEWWWIDQICINQSNDLEKGDQVSRMRAIYGGAECVCVWLGRETMDVKPTAITGTASANITGKLSHDKILNLLDQGPQVWWSRLWVIQEIVSCAAVFVWIGWQSQEWDDFVRMFCQEADRWMRVYKGATDYQQVMRDAQFQLKSLAELRMVLRDKSKGENLLQLLKSTSPVGVTNALDRVYSLLGLATEEDRKNVPVVYGVPRREGFYHMITNAVQRSEDLGLLFRYWPRGRGLGAEPSTGVKEVMHENEQPSKDQLIYFEDPADALPTWMPDFSQPLREYPTTVRDSIRESPEVEWKRSLFPRPFLTFKEGFELHVRAIALDAIDMVFETTKKPTKPRFETVENDPSYSMEQYLSERDDGAPVVVHAGGLFTYLSPEERARDVVQRERSSEPVEQMSDKFSMLLEPRKHESQKREELRFKTTQDHEGYGYEPMQVGDEIIVPFGAKVPLIVRFVASHSVHKQGTFALVGECYVDSIMDWRLTKLANKGKLEEKTYILI